MSVMYRTGALRFIERAESVPGRTDLQRRVRVLQEEWAHPTSTLGLTPPTEWRDVPLVVE